MIIAKVPFSRSFSAVCKFQLHSAGVGSRRLIPTCNRLIACWYYAFLGLSLCLGLVAQNPRESKQQQPPEQAQYAAALNIKDPTARMKEMKRIKAAYPDSGIMYNIDYNLLALTSRSAANFGDLLAAQKDVIAASHVAGRYLILVNAADMVLNHREAAKYPKDVLDTIQNYRAQAMALLDAPETFARYRGETRTLAMNSYKNMFDVPLAKALLMNGKGQEALNLLEAYGKPASPSTDYYVTLGETLQALGRNKDALEAYLEAAVMGHRDAAANAKALYAKINGSDKGFDNELDLRRARRPFQPPPFKAPENWKGKAVLAEVFTGSECGPCVAATFAFDALEKNYPKQYLAVLKYHLPVPLYDPMINPSTKQRQEFYGKVITGTPTAIIDGVVSPRVGGDRQGASISFNNAKKEIDTALEAAAEVTVSASASLSGDVVTVDCVFSKAIEGADYNVALVQTEEEFKGGNGIIQHNMVVRDFKSVAPSLNVGVTFNIAESEKAADAFITEWSKTTNSERNKQLSKTRRNKMDRSKLKAVVFVQDKKTKQVYNSFVADVATTVVAASGN